MCYRLSPLALVVTEQSKVVLSVIVQCDFFISFPLCSNISSHVNRKSTEATYVFSPKKHTEQEEILCDIFDDCTPEQQNNESQHSGSSS